MDTEQPLAPEACGVMIRETQSVTGHVEVRTARASER